MAAILNRTGWIIAICFSIILCPLQVNAEQVPHEIAGIALGSSVDQYPDITQTNFMKEVVVTDYHGFRKGIISYGACRYIDQILKIDMKYQDKSKAFYKKLLKEFRKKFGQPDSWHGDSFGVKYIWKWRFIDDQQNPVSMTLQHNSKDSMETIGNMVKLSYPARIAEERACFNDMCEQSKENIDEKRREELKKSDWSYLIPR
jgi:hypothetical protein